MGQRKHAPHLSSSLIYLWDLAVAFITSESCLLLNQTGLLYLFRWIEWLSRFRRKLMRLFHSQTIQYCSLLPDGLLDTHFSSHMNRRERKCSMSYPYAHPKQISKPSGCRNHHDASFETSSVASIERHRVNGNYFGFDQDASYYTNQRRDNVTIDSPSHEKFLVLQQCETRLKQRTISKY